MLGAISGDIIGSVYENRNYLGKGFNPLFHAKSKFTDDTVCTAAIADSLLSDIDPANTLKTWGRHYWTNGGWGQRFAFWLAAEESKPYNSFGNGAAMRVSSCAWLSDNLEDAIDRATKVTEITHNHPEGIKGAHATTLAIFLARCEIPVSEIRHEVIKEFGYDLSRSVDEIRVNNPYSEACQKSVPEAITCALEANSFEDAIRNAISIGGDSDTIGAIAGSIAEAIFGIPLEIQQLTKDKLPDDIAVVVDRFYSTLKAID